MDFSTDFVRRQARESRRDHERAVDTMRQVMARIFGSDSGEPARAKADFALGGFSRRQFVRLGGVSVATAAVLAACGSDEEPEAAPTESTTTTAFGAGEDMVILRTASSIELLAVEVYQRAIDSGLVKTAVISDAAKLFQEQHGEHAKLFEAATTKAGGKAFTDPNPVVLQSLEPALKALTDERSVVQLALNLEKAAAATYQSAVGSFNDKALNAAVMSVGGVEARHVAVLSSVLDLPPVPVGFQVVEGAIAPGTGV